MVIKSKYILRDTYVGKVKRLRSLMKILSTPAKNVLFKYITLDRYINSKTSSSKTSSKLFVKFCVLQKLFWDIADKIITSPCLACMQHIYCSQPHTYKPIKTRFQNSRQNQQQSCWLLIRFSRMIFAWSMAR